MTAKEQIDNAIGAHGMWKARLRSAIDTGKSDFKTEIVRTDNNCDFGKWLHGAIAPELKNSPAYPSIVKAHAEFHQEAGRILQLAVSGKKAEAEKELAPGSKFSNLSSQLTSAMMAWKSSAK